jgi:hypothetical protein
LNKNFLTFVGAALAATIAAKAVPTNANNVKKLNDHLFITLWFTLIFKTDAKNACVVDCS